MTISLVLLCILFTTGNTHGGHRPKTNAKKESINQDLRRDFETNFHNSDMLHYLKYPNSSLNDEALKVLDFVSTQKFETKAKYARSIKHWVIKKSYLWTCMTVISMPTINKELLCIPTGVFSIIGIIKDLTGYEFSYKTCTRVVDKYANTIEFIRKSGNYSALFLCKTLLQGQGIASDCNINWFVNIPPKYQMPYWGQYEANHESGPLRILQFTDAHYDDGYEVGAETDCGEPQCCNRRSGFPEDPRLGAGFWADYQHCDLPLYTINDTFFQIRKKVCIKS